VKRGDAAPSIGPGIATAFATAALVAYAAAPSDYRRKINAAALRLLREVLTPEAPAGDLSRKYPKAIDVG